MTPAEVVAAGYEHRCTIGVFAYYERDAVGFVLSPDGRLRRAVVGPHHTNHMELLRDLNLRRVLERLAQLAAAATSPGLSQEFSAIGASFAQHGAEVGR